MVLARAQVLVVAVAVAAQCAPAEIQGRNECAPVATDSGYLMTVEGTHVWVPLESIAAATHGVLVAGPYTAALSPDGNGGWHASDRFIGAGWTTPTQSRLIKPPPQVPVDRIRGIRVAPLPRGSWAVVFGEAAPGARRGGGQPIQRFWYGELSPDWSWRHMDSISAPSGTYSLARGSKLVVAEGDSLWYSVPYASPDGERSHLTLSRADSVWRIRRTEPAAYINLAHAPGRGLLAAVVKPDPSLPADRNSLFIEPEFPEGTRSIRLSSVIPGAAHHPIIELTPEEGMVAWVRATEIPRGIGIVARQKQAWKPIVVDSPVTGLTPLFVHRRPFVVVDRSTDQQATELTVYSLDGGRVWKQFSARRISSGSHLASSRDSSLVIVQSVRDLASSDPPIATQYVTLKPASCGSG